MVVNVRVVVVVSVSVAVTVVVPLGHGLSGGGQSPAPGSGSGLSLGANGPAITMERPCASENSAPMTTGDTGIEFSSVKIGFWPVWSLSSTPGFPTYLQMYQLLASGSADAAGATAIPISSSEATAMKATPSLKVLVLRRSRYEPGIGARPSYSYGGRSGDVPVPRAQV